MDYLFYLMEGKSLVPQSINIRFHSRRSGWEDGCGKAEDKKNRNDFLLNVMGQGHKFVNLPMIN
jgi:hypothetical protein